MMQQPMMQQPMMQQPMMQQPMMQQPQVQTQSEQPMVKPEPLKELPGERDLDEAQTRRLTANVVKGLEADPKMRESEFIKFISKMSTGELEIKDGELIHHDGPQMLPGTDWADQFHEGVNKPQTAEEAAEWAQEYADSAWAQEFQ